MIKIIANSKSTAANINTPRLASKAVAKAAPKINPRVAKKRAARIAMIRPKHLQFLPLHSFWLFIQQ